MTDQPFHGRSKEVSKQKPLSSFYNLQFINLNFAMRGCSDRESNPEDENLIFDARDNRKAAGSTPASSAKKRKVSHPHTKGPVPSKGGFFVKKMRPPLMGAANFKIIPLNCDNHPVTVALRHAAADMPIQGKPVIK